MAKIAFVVLGGQGHVNPTLAVAEELVRRNHDVTYWVTENFRASVEAAGVAFRPINSLIAKAERTQHPDSQAVLCELSVRFLDEAMHVLPQLDEVLTDERPDLLMYDNMCIAGRLVAESHGIPAVALFTSYAGNNRFNLLHCLGNMTAEMRDEYDKIMGKIVVHYGVEPFPYTALFGYAQPLNLVFMPRAWQQEGDSFDERFQFVGPCLGTRERREALPAEVLQHQPLLFISLGTGFNDQPEFYRTCFQAFGVSDWTVVMAIGNRTNIAALGKIPANFTVSAHVPQIEVLKHTRVFLTHGGMNSTMEGLSLGIPLVALPQMFEQAVTSRRIVELGVGLSLDGACVTADLLRSSVNQVANDLEIRRQASILKEAVNAAGGPKRAGDLIEAHLAKLANRSIADVAPNSHRSCDIHYQYGKSGFLSAE